MKAVDTNILARFLLDDDPIQSAAARNLLQGDVFISNSVLLETVWLLESRYDLLAGDIAAALRAILKMPGVHMAKSAQVVWALNRFSAGADFADMLHLVESEQHDVFVTFDRKLAKQAGPSSPTKVELLRS